MLRTALLIGLLLLPGPGLARQAGDNVLQFGWAHIAPQESNGAPRNRLRDSPLFPPLEIETSFRSDSVEVIARSADTLAVVFKRFITDHWAFNFTFGVPRKAGLSARGMVGPTGPTRPLLVMDIGRDEFNPVASARQWAPLLLLEYHFRGPGAAVRPFVGAGGTYAFFTEVELNDRFEEAINRRFGTLLAAAAGRPGPTQTVADVDSAVAAAFTAGLDVEVSSRWSLTAAASYVPLETTARVTLEAEDGTRLASSRTPLRLDPVIFTLLAGYRF